VDAEVKSSQVSEEAAAGSRVSRVEGRYFVDRMCTVASQMCDRWWTKYTVRQGGHRVVVVG
jgi:hypothetical protein